MQIYREKRQDELQSLLRGTLGFFIMPLLGKVIFHDMRHEAEYPRGSASRLVYVSPLCREVQHEACGFAVSSALLHR